METVTTSDAPIRTCVGCRQRRPQHELVRCVLDADGQVDGEATVKTFKRTPGQVWLLPHNPAYEPIDGNEATILGKVTAVLRRL